MAKMSGRNVHDRNVYGPNVFFPNIPGSNVLCPDVPCSKLNKKSVAQIGVWPKWVFDPNGCLTLMFVGPNVKGSNMCLIQFYPIVWDLNISGQKILTHKSVA